MRKRESPGAITWETFPVTPKRFDDIADVINPNRRDNHCWCLSHRCTAGEITSLGETRAEAMRTLTEREPQGVVTYRDGVPVGWCSIGPRSRITKLTRAKLTRAKLIRSKLIRPIDDLDLWSIICVVVRGGHRRQGVTEQMLTGAVEHARSHGAPGAEACPVDPDGRMDLTMAFVGTRSMFERVGFEVVGTTDAVASKMPRLVMRRML